MRRTVTGPSVSEAGSDRPIVETEDTAVDYFAVSALSALLLAAGAIGLMLLSRPKRAAQEAPAEQPA